MASLTLIRGLPGSGKSTIAKRMQTSNTVHLEADMYFMLDSEYKFDPSKLSDAHNWCQKMTSQALREGSDVIVSNTFTTAWELKFYFDLAKQFGLVPTVIVAQNQFANVHGVPAEALKRMRDRFQYDISELYK